MAFLAQVGEIWYNGYQFTGPRNSVEIKMINQLDSSGRYVTHNVYRISVDSWITSSTDGIGGDGSDTASRMRNIKQVLGKNGGKFKLTGMGFSDIIVNYGTSDRDVDFGPKVQFINMRNIGNGCIALMWIVDVAVNSCQGAEIGFTGKIKEYVYTVGWSIASNGCTKRTVTGHIEIFNNTIKPDQTLIAETADQYRNNVFIPLMPGFLRNEPQEYTLSADKRRLSFSVTDNEQLSDNAFPPGVADMDLDHTADAELLGTGGGFMNQTCTFTGWMEMAKPYDVGSGWARALLIMQERLVHAVNTNDAAPMILSLSITEKIFRRRISWRLQYRLLTSSLQKFITGSGLFLKVQSTTYAEYINSMQLAWSNRGAAQLEHDPTSDKFVTQCAISSSDSANKFTIKDKLSNSFLKSARGIITLQCPPASNSYLLWNNHISVLSNNSAIQLQEMPRPRSTSSSSDPVTTSSVLSQEMSIQSSEPRKIDVQTTGGGVPTIQVVVSGRAFRVGFTPVIPKLVEVMGKSAGFVKSVGNSTVTTVGSVNGGQCPIYAVTWYNVYEVKFNSISEMNAALGAINVNTAVFDTKDRAAPKVGGL